MKKIFLKHACAFVFTGSVLEQKTCLWLNVPSLFPPKACRPMTWPTPSTTSPDSEQQLWLDTSLVFRSHLSLFSVEQFVYFLHLTASSRTYHQECSISLLLFQTVKSAFQSSYLCFDVKTLFMTITNACKQPSIKRRCSHSFKPPFCALWLVWKCMLIEICAQGKKWSFFARGYKTCKNQCVDHLYHFFQSAYVLFCKTSQCTQNPNILTSLRQIACYSHRTLLC